MRRLQIDCGLADNSTAGCNQSTAIFAPNLGLFYLAQRHYWTCLVRVAPDRPLPANRPSTVSYGIAETSKPHIL